LRATAQHTSKLYMLAGLHKSLRVAVPADASSTGPRTFYALPPSFLLWFFQIYHYSSLMRRDHWSILHRNVVVLPTLQLNDNPLVSSSLLSPLPYTPPIPSPHHPA